MSGSRWKGRRGIAQADAGLEFQQCCKPLTGTTTPELAILLRNEGSRPSIAGTAYQRVAAARSSVKTIVPLRKTVTVPVDWLTVTAIACVWTVIAAAV